MEPTNTQIAEFATIQDITKWAGMKGDYSDTTSTVGSFFSIMGFEPDEHWRTLAMITEPDLKEILKNWEIDKSDGKVKATPGQIAQAGPVGVAARLAGGTQLRMADRRAADAAAAEASAAAAVNANSTSSTPKRTVPMSEVVDTVCKDEAPMLDQTAVDRFHTTYRKWRHENPPWKEDTTVEQISAVYSLLKDKAIPYCDLAVFGPHGQRALRNVRLTGMTIGPDGRLIKLEMKGPATPEAWCQCMEVVSTVLIGLDAVMLPSIARYIKKILAYAHSPCTLR